MLFVVFPVFAYADVTLRCNPNNKCDAYNKNCSHDPYTITINISPTRKIVTVGSTQIKADFSNPATVDFEFLGQTISINKYEYSILLFSATGVRYGYCTTVKPAW
jgi:hypothetical protein